MDEEILTIATDFEYYGLDNTWTKISLQPGNWAATFCQVPVVFTNAQDDGILINYSDGKQKKIKGLSLSGEESKKIFERDGEISRINVSFKKDNQDG